MCRIHHVSTFLNLSHIFHLMIITSLSARFRNTAFQPLIYSLFLQACFHSIIVAPLLFSFWSCPFHNGRLAAKPVFFFNLSSLAFNHGRRRGTPPALRMRGTWFRVLPSVLAARFFICKHTRSQNKSDLAVSIHLALHQRAGAAFSRSGAGCSRLPHDFSIKRQIEGRARSVLYYGEWRKCGRLRRREGSKAASYMRSRIFAATCECLHQEELASSVSICKKR